MGPEGVHVRTECGHSLKLTREHLVWAEGGFMRAGDVRQGHRVRVAGDETCAVASVEPAQGPWFGVQCLESEVKANGVHASVFAHYHAVPAVYMRWMGWAVGARRAAELGQHVSAAARFVGFI